MNETYSSFNIPRSCLKQSTMAKNLFSVELFTNHSCPVEWKPLDACRKYQLEMKSEYSNSWASAPFTLETFSAQQGRVLG